MPVLSPFLMLNVQQGALYFHTLLDEEAADFWNISTTRPVMRIGFSTCPQTAEQAATYPDMTPTGNAAYGLMFVTGLLPQMQAHNTFRTLVTQDARVKVIKATPHFAEENDITLRHFIQNYFGQNTDFQPRDPVLDGHIDDEAPTEILQYFQLPPPDDMHAPGTPEDGMEI